MTQNVTKINDVTYQIDDGDMVRCFLLVGKEKALLIDTAMNIEAKKIAEELTDLPVELIITHADGDHIGSVKDFAEFYMHPSEASNYYNSQKRDVEFVPVEDKEIIDLGGRKIQVILIPGHTPGSIALLDLDNRFLFSGDPIQDGSIFMFGVQREIHAYLKSLEKLDAYRKDFDKIFPAHGTCPVKPGLIDDLKVAAKEIIDGKIDGEEVEMFGNKIKKYDVKVAAFLMAA